MIENFTAIISANIRKFQSKIREANRDASLMTKESIKPIKADTTQATNEINKLKQEISSLTNEKAKLNVDINEARQSLISIQKEISKIKNEQLKLKATINKGQFDRDIAEMKAKETEFKKDIKQNFYANTRPYRNELDLIERCMRSLEMQARKMGKELRDVMTPSQIQNYREYQKALLDTRKAMLPFKLQQLAIQGAFFKMSQAGDEYAGKTNKWISDIKRLGAEDKKIKDQMINSNNMLRMAYVRQAGRMMNLTTQAQRISENYSRMGNVFYSVSKPGLAVANTLNKIANNGSPAVTALRMLGPQASNKQLRDMVMMINQGLMRTSMVALAAAASSYFLYSSLHKNAMKTNQAYAEAFNGMKESLYKAFAPMREVFQQVMIKVYEFITVIGNLISKFNESHPTIAKIIQGIMLLIPALTLILSPLAIGIGLFGGFRSALFGVWTLIGPLITGFGAISGTVLLVAGVIVGLVAAFMYLWNNNETFKNYIITAWNYIKEKAIEIWENVKTVLITVWSALKEFFTSVWNGILEFWNQYGTQITQAIITVWELIKIYFAKFKEAVLPIFENLWNAIVTGVQIAWDYIKGIIEGALNIIKGIILVVTGLINADFQTFWEGVKLIFSGALQVITTILQTTWDLIKLAIETAWNAIKAVLQIAWEFIKSVAETVWNAIKEFFTTTLNNIQNTFNLVWNSIKVLIQTVINIIQSIITSVWNTIKSFIMGVMNGIKTVVTNTWNSVKTIVSTVMTNVKNFIVNGWNSVVSFLTGINLFEAGKAIIEGFLNGLKAVWGKVKSFVGGIADWVRNNKGPISYDRRLLIPAGKAIMGGFNESLQKSFKYVKNSIYGMNEELKTSFGGVVDVTSDLKSLSVQHRQNLHSELHEEIEQGKQPMEINVTLGKKEFRAVVDDITEEQNKKERIRLKTV